MVLPLLLQLAAAQLVPACDTIRALIDVDLRVAGECRVYGLPDARARASDLPFRTLSIDGFDERALTKLRNGLDHWVRVVTPLAEANLRGSIGNAFDDFEDALEREPRLTEAAVAATELALRTRLEDDMRRAVEIAGRASDRARVAPYVAELHLSLNQPDSVDVAELLLEPEGRRAAAIALLMGDERDAWTRGDSLYFDAARADSAALSRAIADVLPIMPEVAEVSAADLQRVWDILAAEAAVDRAERLHVHFERLLYAYEAYYDWPRVPTRVIGEDVLTQFDMRGVIYLRHGAPDQRITSLAQRAKCGMALPLQFDTWIYASGWSGGFAAHFSGCNRDWTFVSTVPGCDTEWIATRAALDGRLAGMMLPCRQGDVTGAAGARAAEISRDMRAELRAAIASQSVDLGLRELLVARGSVHRLRGADGTQELLVVGGVRVDPGITDTLGAGARFTLEMDAHIASAAGGARASTSLTTSTTQVGSPGYATLDVMLPAPRGPGLARVVLRDADSTHIGAALSIGVQPASDDAGIAMSDVVLLSLDSPPTLERHGLRLAPMPDVVGGERFAVYFELYDVPADADSYVATIRGRAAGDDPLIGAPDEIALTFESRPNLVGPGVAAELLEIRSPDWEPGEYVLTVEVHVAESILTRQRTILVE